MNKLCKININSAQKNCISVNGVDGRDNGWNLRIDEQKSPASNCEI